MPPGHPLEVGQIRRQVPWHGAFSTDHPVFRNRSHQNDIAHGSHCHGCRNMRMMLIVLERDVLERVLEQ